MRTLLASDSVPVARSTVGVVKPTLSHRRIDDLERDPLLRKPDDPSLGWLWWEHPTDMRESREPILEEISIAHNRGKSIEILGILQELLNTKLLDGYIHFL